MPHPPRLKRLEDLYLPFRPKKQTLSTKAREQGLGPLAEEILAKDKACANLDGRAADFVKKNVGQAPLFLWIATTAPHAPHEPARRHLYAHADKRAPRSPNFNEADLGDKPRWYRDNLPLLSANDIADLDGVYKRRVETLQAVDDMLERRAGGEPLQYVLGRWDFLGLDLLVDRRVLVPRPETEVVAQTAIMEAVRLGSRRGKHDGWLAAETSYAVADLGTARMSAISPKCSPAPRRVRISPPRETRTLPERTMKSSSPLSPSRITTCSGS